MIEVLLFYEAYVTSCAGILICILQMAEMRFKEFRKLTWHHIGRE